ncbi:hypothetical protein EBESD8_49840 [Rhodococcus aetherivorans]|nr:hypothetical protein EBESD8_49840 [Rhodococcus aetherivorans]
MDNTELAVATWNTMWASGSTSRAVRVRRRLREVDADLLVVTEGQRDLLPDGGHVADAGTHSGGTTSPPIPAGARPCCGRGGRSPRWQR